MAMMIDAAASKHVGGVINSSPSSAIAPCHYPRISLPRCKGLRVVDAPSKLSSSPSLSSLTSISVHQRGTVVCKQQQDVLNSAGNVTDKTWKALVLDSEIPVLVDFWAPWCGPCRMIAPLFDELAIQYAGKVRCLKLNTDECPTIATDCGIRSIPTVMIFKNGQKYDTIVGAVPKAALISAIDKFLDK